MPHEGETDLVLVRDVLDVVGDGHGAGTEVVRMMAFRLLLGLRVAGAATGRTDIGREAAGVRSRPKSRNAIMGKKRDMCSAPFVCAEVERVGFGDGVALRLPNGAGSVGSDRRVPSFGLEDKSALRCPLREHIAPNDRESSSCHRKIWYAQTHPTLHAIGLAFCALSVVWNLGAAGAAADFEDACTDGIQR